MANELTGEIAEILDERQVSRRYGLSKPWLRKARRERRGPPFLKIGKMVRYRRQAVEAFLAAHTVNTDDTDDDGKELSRL